MLATSGVGLASPSATVNQAIANDSSASSPTRPNHCIAEAAVSKPSRNAVPKTVASASAVWIIAPRTWPVSTETLATAMVRNRSMIPPVMSVATETAVLMDTLATAITKIPGVMNVR
ncbi:hypothetical protein SUDANB176_07819 (plasmid) [Streptomyces sp. enrichment culture]